MEPIFQALQGAGGIGIWVVVFYLWRLDRRVFELELRSGIKAKGKIDEVVS